MVRREIVIVAFPGVQPLDVSGPYEVFAGADKLSTPQAPGFHVRVVAPQAGLVRGESGLGLYADAGLGALRRGPLDTLIVAGGWGVREALSDRRLVRALQSGAARARRVASVCTGAFLLAEAGLLEGRRVTTHWAACEELHARYPQLNIDPEPIYVRDGDLYTSAGVTAGMDLALALVEEDLGREVALTVARWLVLFLRRPANQAQFSAHLQGQLAARDALRELQRWALEHPADDLSVEALAARASLSPRHFARTFTREVGTTPGRYVERIRIEAARRALEDSSTPVAQVAAQCGFGTPETMRRSFLRALGVSPAEYRRRFVRAA